LGVSAPVAWTGELDLLLEDEEIDAVVFASTEDAAHGGALAALEADKHVYIEGPLSRTVVEANELVRAAERRDRCLWAQSGALGGPSTDRMRALMERGALGEIFYLHARRFVLHRKDASSLLWDIGADVVALALELLCDEPIDVRARRESYLGRGEADVVLAELRFATGIVVHMHLSCLEGDTVDRLSVVGSELTAALDWRSPRELVLHASGASARSLEALPVEPGSSVALLVQEDAATSSHARFLGSLRAPTYAQHGRRAATVVALVEQLSDPLGAIRPEPVAPHAAGDGPTLVELRGG
jgi:predicted dehydrogenase